MSNASNSIVREIMKSVLNESVMSESAMNESGKMFPTNIFNGMFKKNAAEVLRKHNRNDYVIWVDVFNISPKDFDSAMKKSPAMYTNIANDMVRDGKILKSDLISLVKETIEDFVRTYKRDIASESYSVLLALGLGN